MPGTQNIIDSRANITLIPRNSEQLGAIIAGTQGDENYSKIGKLSFH